MKAKLDALCRGDGIVYLHLGITDADAIDGLGVEVAANNGAPLPCNWYVLQSMPQTRAYNVAVAVPLLAGGGMRLTLTAPDGSPCKPGRIDLSEKRITWESRLTYKTKADIAAAIRDIDELNDQRAIRVQFDYVLPDIGDPIVHAVLTMPYYEDSQILATVLDPQGQVTGIEPVNMGDIVVPSGFDPSMRLRKRTVSFRIPKDTPGFTLVACDELHPELTGFRSALAHHVVELIGKGTRYWLTAGIDPEYDRLFRMHRTDERTLQRQRAATFAHDYLFSIIVPLYKTPLPLFQEMLDSVLAQTYGTWELVLVDASPEDEQLAQAVRNAAVADARVRYTMLTENLGITENTNFGIAAAKGDFVCFLDHDDVIEPDLLFEYACALQEQPDIDLLYCDEDKMSQDGSKFYEAFFKSDFDLELLRCNNFVCHLLTVRKELLDQLEPPTARYDGAQDHHLTLRIAERTQRIHHVPKVLYHWRATEHSTAANPGEGAEEIKPYAITAGRIAIGEHLERMGISASIEDGPAPFTHHVIYDVIGQPLVSIVIPNKDCVDYLRRCVDSIVAKTDYANYEIVVVENNSVDPATFAYYEELQAADAPARVRVVTWEGDGEFNFSKLVNFGVQHAQGDYLLLLNNDTEVLTERWLRVMLGMCQQDGIGAVGAHLLYPDETTQHAGIFIPEESQYALHELVGAPIANQGYFYRAGMTHNCIAVTGACMMVGREAFQRVGGFSEELSVAYNDVDFCLKLRDAGLRVIYESAAKLVHYESVSRGLDYADAEKRARMLKEASLLKSKWAHVYVKGDPFYNPNMNDLYHLAWH